MLVQILLFAAASCILGVIASVVMTRAGNRSPAWNIWFGAVLGMAVILSGLAVAVLLTQTAFGP